MAIGGPSGNNPLADLFKYNSTAGVAQNNQTEKVPSTEETSVDNTSKSAGRIAQLRAEALGDVFKTAGPNDVAKTAGASPINLTKLDKTPGITEVSALGEPSSVAAIGVPVRPFVTDGNPEVAFGNQQLLLAAKMSQAAGISNDGFQVATANAELEGYNRLLVG